MEEKQEKNKIAPLWALIVVVIIAGVVFLVFRSTPQADAPTVDDGTEVATTTEEGVTETVEDPATSGGTGYKPETQVIQGDGYTAILRPVSGEAPVVVSFTVQQDDSCIFKWEVEKAANCDLENTTDGTAVKSVPVKGTLQTSDAGTYRLKCKGTGGKTKTSEVVTCN